MVYPNGDEGVKRRRTRDALEGLGRLSSVNLFQIQPKDNAPCHHRPQRLVLRLPHGFHFDVVLVAGGETRGRGELEASVGRIVLPEALDLFSLSPKPRSQHGEQRCTGRPSRG